MKDHFLDYLKLLQGYSQNENFGMPLLLLNYSRLQMHRGDLTSKSIQIGCVNVTGEYASGKSTTVKLLSK